MIRIIFYIFSSIFKGLAVKFIISRLQNYPNINTRAAASAIVNYNVKFENMAILAITEDS